LSRLAVVMLSLKVPPPHHVDSTLNDCFDEAGTLAHDHESDDVVEHEHVAQNGSDLKRRVKTL